MLKVIKGTLIVNSFLHTEQVNETYDMLVQSAKQHHIDMDICGNASFFARLDKRAVEPELEKGDFILFWNKDVFLARALENQGYRLYNSASAIEVCDDKALTFERLNGIVKMPKTYKIPMTFDTVGYDSFEFERYLGEALGYPYVIKESFGSYGGQVYLADNSQEACRILKKIEGKECLAQEYINESRGRDIRAYVVGDRVVAAIERKNDSDFRANITNGGSAYAYVVSDEEALMAVKVVKELGLDFAGVDILFGKDGPILCEVNSNAQFKGLYNATGISIPDAIFEMIANLEKR